MASQYGHEKGPSITSADYSTSNSGSSDGSNSTPTTPPSPVALLHPNPMVVEPQVIPADKNSSMSPRSARKTTPPRSRLGVIDEHSDSISPDLPMRNPRRLLGTMQHSKLFQLAFPPTLSSTRDPPKKLYDDIEGPHGEKFVDVRNNQRSPTPGRGGWKRLVCLGLVVLMVGAVVAIILIAVLLTRKKATRNQAVQNNSTGSDSTNQGFPTGSYAISTYLTETDESCTVNSSTWRCSPYTTYNQSQTSSYTTLNWVIKTNATSGANNSYLISSVDALFSYAFQSRPLTLENANTDNEAYTFTYSYVKTVFPTVALTSDNVKTICYYNNTLLTARLFTKKPKQATLTTANSTTTGSNVQWPFAIEYGETVQAGTNVPNCYRNVNGAVGDRVEVTGTNTVTGGSCRCSYENYEL